MITIPTFAGNSIVSVKSVMETKMDYWVENSIITAVQNGILKIILNRPKRKNAISVPMYLKLSAILNNYAGDDNVRIAVLTGAGEFFSSGNDIGPQLFEANESLGIENAVAAFKGFVDALIMFPKPLVAIVNGPAIGIGATMLGLFDIIYASETAYFYTPFSNLGLIAEGCSSYTFPRILGNSKASEMLYLGYKMTAAEAKQYNFVSKIYVSDELDNVWTFLEKVVSLSMHSILKTKALVRRWNQKTLLEVNDTEAKELLKIWESPEFAERLFNFMLKKSKM